MTIGDQPTRQIRLERVKPGDPVSAAQWNKLCIELERLTAYNPQHPKKPTRAIKLLKLSQIIGQFGDGWPLNGGDGDSSLAHRRDGIVQYYDDVLDDFVPTSDEETKGNITDALKLIYDENELVWCVYLEQSGHWHPINPRTVRHAITVREPNSEGGSSYPDYCPTNVFPIRFIRINDYLKEGGYQFPSFQEMSGGTEPDDYVMNLFTGSEENPYPTIPEGTLIWVYNVANFWFTYVCCFTCPESSGSSSSSSSSSDSSQSSSSDSSGGSSQSTELSSGGSSASSASQSLSISGSSQLFSSGGSSGSSNLYSDGEGNVCIQVVTSVNFNEETCELTYGVGCLCWPQSLGISFLPYACS